MYSAQQFAMKGHLEKMECTANKDFVYNYSCSVNKSMGESGSFSGTAYLQPNVTLTRQWVTKMPNSIG